jgi:hypothetical protein
MNRRAQITVSVLVAVAAFAWGASSHRSVAEADSDDSQRALMLRLVRAQETQAHAMQEIARRVARCK